MVATQILMDSPVESDAWLDEAVERNGGRLELVNTGIMETLGNPISLLLDNEDVVLDEVVERNGGRLELVNTGILIGGTEM
jgi:hypothetical protein